MLIVKTSLLFDHVLLDGCYSHFAVDDNKSTSNTETAAMVTVMAVATLVIQKMDTANNMIVIQ